MHFSNIVAISLPIIGTFALPQGTTCVESSTITTATSTAAASTATPGAFTILAARSGSPIHLASVNASDSKLWIYKDTASFCPDVDTVDCPPGDVTAFLGLCGMDVEVPGGQRVYVTPDGAFGYTQAHSGVAPDNAVFCPFVYRQGPSINGFVSTDAFGATDFMACPAGGDGIYQVFANIPNATVPNGNVSDCLGFDGDANVFTGGFAAWQYD